MNKPNGQFVITPAEVPAFLQTLPLAKIPGVGKVSAAKLEAMGLRTCGDVQKCDLVTLLKRFGKFGRSVVRALTSATLTAKGCENPSV